MAVVGLVRPPRRSFSRSSHETSVFSVSISIHLDVRMVWPGIFDSLDGRFGHLPSGGTSRCEGWDWFQIQQSLQISNRSRDSGFSFSQYLYTIMLSNIRVENTVQYGERNSRRSTRCKGMDLDGAGTGSEQDRRAAERQHSATVER